MIFDGWCPDCDIRSAVIDTGDSDQTGSDTTAWAFCTECGAGWIHRDELPELAGVSGVRMSSTEATDTGANGSKVTDTAATDTAPAGSESTNTKAARTEASSTEERRAA